MNMRIKDVNKADIENALNNVNAYYEGNVKLAVCVPLNKAKKRWRVRLTVKDSHKKGARRGMSNGYHLKSACWHVYGKFLNYLPFGTEVRSVLGVHHCGMSDWKDKNIGSWMYPVYLSLCCVCVGKSFVPIKVQIQREKEALAKMEEERLKRIEDDLEFEKHKEALDNDITARFTHKYRSCSD